MSDKLRLMITYDEPDEDGWIVARVLQVPGAISQGRTREEARENVPDALQELALSYLGGEPPPHARGESEPLDVIIR